MHKTKHIIIIIIFLLVLIFPWSSFIKGGLNLSSMLITPSIQHPLGTDNLGRDLLLRFSTAIKGSVLPLWTAILITNILAISAAAFAIILRSKNWIFKSLVTGSILLLSFIGSIPIGILSFLWSALQEHTGIYSVISGLSALFFVRTYLYIFNLYNQDEKLGFWVAHKSIGGSLLNRILHYGILRKWKKLLIDSVIFQMQVGITIEASLSYLGFGISEPQASFGNILSSHFNLILKGQWWAISITILILYLTISFPRSVFSISRFHFYRLRPRKPE